MFAFKRITAMHSHINNCSVMVQPCVRRLVPSHITQPNRYFVKMQWFFFLNIFRYCEIFFFKYFCSSLRGNDYRRLESSTRRVQKIIRARTIFGAITDNWCQKKNFFFLRIWGGKNDRRPFCLARLPVSHSLTQNLCTIMTFHVCFPHQISRENCKFQKKKK